MVACKDNSNEDESRDEDESYHNDNLNQKHIRDHSKSSHLHPEFAACLTNYKPQCEFDSAVSASISLTLLMSFRALTPRQAAATLTMPVYACIEPATS